MTALPCRAIGFALAAMALIGWPAGALAATGGLGSAVVAHPASRLAVAAASARPMAPTGSLPNDSLRGISCVSRSFCMAVGGFTGSRGGARWLAERWNGSRWRVLTGVKGGSAAGVSCTGVRFCMSVGNPPAVWRGTTWRALKPKSPVNAAVLSCTSAQFCMAVGSSSDELSSWKWNGHGWRKLTTPQVGCVPDCGLSGVTCVSARDCLAIGFSADNSGNTQRGIGLAWNGTAWHDASPPTPGFASLSGVSCATVVSCVTFGRYESAGQGPCYASYCLLVMTLADGTWQQVTTPPVAPELSGISCPAVAGCVAVGLGQAWSLHGSTWRHLTIATRGVSTNLAAVSCWRPSACVAAGSYQPSAGGQRTLAEEWNGSTWTVLSMPSP